MNPLSPNPSVNHHKSAMPLYQKLLFTFLPVGLLPIVITGGLSGVFTYQKASQQARLRLHNLAIVTAELTHKDLEGKMTLLATVGANPLILDAVRTGTQQAEAANLENLPIEKVEAKFANTKLLQPNPSLNNYLQNVAKIGNFAEVFFTERNGFNIAYSQPTSDFVQRDEKWWVNGKQQKQWIGMPKFDESSQKVTLEIIEAIIDPDSGAFLGVFKGGYDATRLEYLTRELQNLQLTDSEQLQILAVGEKVTAIATLNEEGISASQDIPGKTSILEHLSQLPKDDQKTNAQTYAQIEMASWIDGDRRYTMATIPHTNWLAVSSVKLAQIQAAGYQLASLFGLFFLGLGVVTTGVILRFSRTLSAPVNNLASVAQQVTEKSDFNIQAPVTTQDHEVNLLAKSFNQLLQRVQKLLQEQAEAQKKLEIYSQTLEQKVQERTQELEVYSQTLEQKVQERTQELKEKTLYLEQTLQQLQRTQSQMVQAEKMSSLGQLVAGIAHEINNPVNFIHGNIIHADQYAQDLLNLLHLYQIEYPDGSESLAEKIAEIDLEFLREDLPKLLTSMKVGAERIREIVKSLRIFSRLDESDLKTVDIHEGIDSTLMILHHRFKAKSDRDSIEVIKNYGQIPLVECYGGQLNQVFMNILANAIDALEEIHIQQTNQEIAAKSLHIRIRTSMVDSQWVQIACCEADPCGIADNGPGIPNHVQQRIFDPFFTTKPVGKGTGMGMSISYQIITEKHKGKLECLSSPEAGTEFIIQIPIRQPS